MNTPDLIHAYYGAFNDGRIEDMLDCLHDEIEHHVNEGGVRRGKALFRAFCDHMSACYREQLTDIVIFASEDGERAAAEFIVNGTYLKTDEGLPEAHGQTYRLPAGTFFTVRDGKIARVTTYYNLRDWLRQVGA